MNKFVVASMLGLVGLAGVGCGGDGDTCGAGTTLVGSVCVANGADGPISMTDAGTTCGLGTTNNNGVCQLGPNVCIQGSVLNADKSACVSPTHGDLVAGPLTMDRHWFFWKYLSNGTLSVLGDATSLTANVPDSTEMYMAGIGTGPPGSGPTDPAKNDKFGLHNGGVIPVFWDANKANPSDTPFAIDHVITVGEWKTCTLTWSVYKNPPRKDAKKYYRLVMDATGCPSNLVFETWFNYFNDKFINTRILGTPAGGIPNVFVSLEDGTGHWERDFDPNIWTKYGVALNGNTHMAGTGKGFVPAAPSGTAVPTFTMAVFVHNDGQSNGNAGWCPEADGATGVPGVCGTPYYVGSAPSMVAPTSQPYIYLPGKVGFESTPAFAGGDDPMATKANTIPLSMLQPY